MIYTLTRDGCDEQKEGIYDGLIDVPGVLIEPPPRRAGLGQLAELLLERREAGLVVGHGVLGEMGWALASCSAAGSPYVPAVACPLLRFRSLRRRVCSVRRVFRADNSDPSLLNGIQAHP